MRYVKTPTSIPVPEVYYHDKDKNGEVGGQWMILEDVRKVLGTTMCTKLKYIRFKEQILSVHG